MDLSHVAVETMKVALAVTEAPVIYSHSSSFQLCNHYRNVPDDVLKLVVGSNTGSCHLMFSLKLDCKIPYKILYF